MQQNERIAAMYVLSRAAQEPAHHCDFDRRSAAPRVASDCAGNGEVPDVNMLRAIEHRWSGVTDSYAVKEEILDRRARELATRFRHNIECYIGTLRIPLGLAGPLSVNGDYARGEYLVPLATTEATLVASYDRGSRLISECNGCTSMITEEALGRSPGFVFADLRQVRCFQQWIDAQGETLRRVAAATSRYGRLKALKLTVEGNHVYLNFEFMTGDAAGQNMATIATEALVRFILDNSPVTPIRHFIEANHCGDKKASFRSLIGVRGKRVSAEVVVPDSLIRRRLHTSAAAMEDYWRMAALGGVLSGTLGVQGHYANGLAALFLACGQDVACVAEAATGVTRIETCGSGDLYAAVTIPALVVGTVGGGTGLPAQQACLRLMKLNGPGNASAFAEVCAAVALAGELSIMGAICSQEFARSHRRRARGGKVPNLGA